MWEIIFVFRGSACGALMGKSRMNDDFDRT